jgi:hypothetical protein
MNIIIFLAISSIISVRVTAEYSYGDLLYSRGTLIEESDVLTSPLTLIEESGYFSFLSYTNSNCNDNSNLALVGSLLLNTCSRSFDGNYTKVK